MLATHISPLADTQVTQKMHRCDHNSACVWCNNALLLAPQWLQDGGTEHSVVILLVILATSHMPHHVTQHQQMPSKYYYYQCTGYWCLSTCLSMQKLKQRPNKSTAAPNVIHQTRFALTSNFNLKAMGFTFSIHVLQYTWVTCVQSVIVLGTKELELFPET